VYVFIVYMYVFSDMHMLVCMYTCMRVHDAWRYSFILDRLIAKSYSTCSMCVCKV
jgi:hypothetical protein